MFASKLNLGGTSTAAQRHNMTKDQQWCVAATCSQSSTIARSAAGAFGGSDGRAPCRQTFTAIFAGSKPLAQPLLAWEPLERQT